MNKEKINKIVSDLEVKLDEIFNILNECRTTLICTSLIDKSSLSKDTLKKVEDIFDRNQSYKKKYRA